MNMTTEAVILGNGDYPSHPYPLNVLRQAPYVVCCDGAADEYIRHGFLPDAIIGDGDSLSSENREKLATIFHQIKDQETNDQTKAVRFLKAQGKRQIAIIGGTGKREDHTLGNISLLMDYMQEGLQVRMITDYGVFIPSCDTQRFDAHPGQQVSIQLRRYRITRGRIGLSAKRFQQLVARNVKRGNRRGILHSCHRQIPRIY